MLRTSFVLSVTLLGACYSGPNQLEYYRAPSLTVHAHVADVPADSPGYAEISLAMVELGLDRFPQPQASLVPTWGRSTRAEPMTAGDVQFVVGTDYYLARNAPSYLPQLRFFRLWATLPTAMGGPPEAPSAVSWYPGTWSPPGVELVWAASAATFSPFGPAYPGVTVPAGYSWLRRQCGPAPGQIQTEVRPIDETVVFQHADWTPTSGIPPCLEPLERSYVESCGAVAPAQDLGTRVSFDRTSLAPIVWSADGANLYYLSQPDPQDTTKTVGVRKISLADGSSSEIATAPLGGHLQRDSAGQLYLADYDRQYRVTATAGGPATLTALPIPGDAVLSPDGQWFVGRGTLWSVATGEAVATFDGNFVGWSPDSRAAFLAGEPLVLNVVSPALPTQPNVYPAADASMIAWSSLGPMLVQTPVDWPDDNYSFCMSCFGLVLHNLADGSVRQVLDASAGMIDLVATPPMLDTILVWARSCLGLYNTVCSYSLLRVRLSDGAVQIVAVSPDKYPVGLSPDGQRVAIAAPSGIYVKTISP